MHASLRPLAPSVAALALLLASTSSVAAPASQSDADGRPTETNAAATSSPFHADAELDPTAFALSGYSLHVGLGYKRVRLDLGAYAMRMPELIHGNPSFDVSFDGFGAKLHYFFLAEQRGLFAGVDVGLTRVLVERRGTDLASRHGQVGIGVHAGYRFALPAGFYATAWVGVGYSPNAKSVTLGGATLKANPITVFPAIHLGYRFR